MKRSAMKSGSRPKSTAIRASARDQECTLRFPGICNYRTDTTVLCHKNGAGAGMKSADEDGAYGCCDCHRVLDGHAPRPAGFTRELMLALFAEGNAQTRRILDRAGLLPTGPAEKKIKKSKSCKLVATNRSFLFKQLSGVAE